jgi:hypothetical protein
MQSSEQDNQILFEITDKRGGYRFGQWRGKDELDAYLNMMRNNPRANKNSQGEVVDENGAPVSAVPYYILVEEV